MAKWSDNEPEAPAHYAARQPMRYNKTLLMLEWYGKRLQRWCMLWLTKQV